MMRRILPIQSPERLPTRHQRRGTVLVMALACLLIVMAILGTMLQSALRGRRQLHAERDRIETELLLQAGADRAALRLSGDPEFNGDTWDLPANAIVDSGAGRVETTVTRGDANHTRQVHVAAEFPLGSERSIRRSRTFLFTIPTSPAQE